VIHEPLVHALAVEPVLASRESLQLRAVDERAEADAALRLLRRRALVKDDRYPLDRGGVEAVMRRKHRRCVVRRDGVEEEAVLVADPAREDEERGEEEDDGEKDDDEEELAAADFEVLVVELVIVPIEGLGIANRHGGRFEKEARWRSKTTALGRVV